MIFPYRSRRGLGAPFPVTELQVWTSDGELYREPYRGSRCRGRKGIRRGLCEDCDRQCGSDPQDLRR